MESVNDDLFSIDKLEHIGNLIKAELSINSASSIFKGHFPGQPVVPGACMLQTVKEVLENTFKQPLQLQKANNLKFINMIDPLRFSSVQLEITYRIENDLNITAKLITSEIVFFKFQGIFINSNNQ